MKKAVRLLAAIAGVSAIVALSFMGECYGAGGSWPRRDSASAEHVGTNDYWCDNDGDISRHNPGHLRCRPDAQGDPAYDRGTWWW